MMGAGLLHLLAVGTLVTESVLVQQSALQPLTATSPTRELNLTSMMRMAREKECPSACSGHGRCLKRGSLARCRCDSDWDGDDCSAAAAAAGEVKSPADPQQPQQQQQQRPDGLEPEQLQDSHKPTTPEANPAPDASGLNKHPQAQPQPQPPQPQPPQPPPQPQQETKKQTPPEAKPAPDASGLGKSPPQQPQPQPEPQVPPPQQQQDAKKPYWKKKQPVAATNTPPGQGFTVVLMSYQGSDFARHADATKIVANLAAHPLVQKVLFVWNSPGTVSPIPESGNVKVLTQANSLNNRWLIANEITTDGVYVMDDDLELKPESLTCMFQKWQQQPKSIMGVQARGMTADKEYCYSPGNAGNGGPGECTWNMVLPRAIFVHKDVLSSYGGPTNEAMRSFVDTHEGHCDDFLMNFVAANHNDCQVAARLASVCAHEKSYSAGAGRPGTNVNRAPLRGECYRTFLKHFKCEPLAFNLAGPVDCAVDCDPDFKQSFGALPIHKD